MDRVGLQTARCVYSVAHEKRNTISISIVLADLVSKRSFASSVCPRLILPSSFLNVRCAVPALCGVSNIAARRSCRVVFAQTTTLPTPSAANIVAEATIQLATARWLGISVAPQIALIAYVYALIARRLSRLRVSYAMCVGVVAITSASHVKLHGHRMTNIGHVVVNLVMGSCAQMRERALSGR